MSIPIQCLLLAVRSWQHCADKVCCRAPDDDHAFYLFFQKQKIALKPYNPPLGTSQQSMNLKGKVLKSKNISSRWNSVGTMSSPHSMVSNQVCPLTFCPHQPDVPACCKPRFSACSRISHPGPFLLRSLG